MTINAKFADYLAFFDPLVYIYPMAEKNTSAWLTLLKKISGIIIRLRFSKVPVEYRYFIRDTYVCKLNQLKYFIHDYIIRKPYKIVSYEGEFGAELMFALPFAYWHYLNGTLKQTNSFPFTKEFYFFSPDHNEVFTQRSNEGNYNYELPRILFSHDYNMKKWLPAPLKQLYKNDIYVFSKPMLIIANRYNMEWDGPPVSFLSIDMLDFIISKLKDKYTILYNRPRPKDIVNDNSEVYDLDEYGWLEKSHPEVLWFNNLYDENRIGARNFNHFQLHIYANCENFISVHGGTASLASYFGGTNIIYSQEGVEHYFKCFEKLFPQLSGAEIFHAKNKNEFEQFVNEKFINKVKKKR